MKISRLLIVIITLFSMSSCYEEPLTKGIITVYDSEGNTVSGAVVKLYQEEIVGVTQTNVVSTLVSDFNGQTEHVLELEALMSVEAYTFSGSTSADTLLYGTTVIRLMRGKTIYKNIEILPLN
ncbi:MAG: hypothetical protein VXZ76_03335 [Bacteroidota bacterium]|nr:hypothetical protein [Bacteroidota bacterium]